MTALPLAVAVVVEQGDRFLLIRRGDEPFRGWWSPVTGRVEPGESLAQAAVREAREEMGIDVAVAGHAGAEFYVCPTLDGSHELHFLYAQWTGGEPVPCPREVMEWGWFTLEEAEALDPVFQSDLAALRSLRA